VRRALHGTIRWNLVYLERKTGQARRLLIPIEVQGENYHLKADLLGDRIALLVTAAGWGKGSARLAIAEVPSYSARS
jgi:hypothetical protein